MIRTIKHQMHLDLTAFAKVVSGNKTIESRLYDKKRKLIYVGDTITFINLANTSENIETEVTGLSIYHSFETMFQDCSPVLFGGGTATELLHEIRKYYTSDDERGGVIGISFRIKAGQSQPKI
jgi:ASC-1-like (ASCH) protein